MAAVHLEFLPPDEDNVVTLHVEEAALIGGSYSEIQTFDAGDYPNYIREADVTTATNPLHWFRIRWENASGNFTPYSSPIQGGTTTLVAQIMDRVLLRDPTVNPLIAGQESEATISTYFGVDDPYSIDPVKGTPKVLSGLTLLTLARTYTLRMIELVTSNNQKWTVGLVSMDAGSISAKSWDAIDRFIQLANKELGTGYSRILLLEEISVAGGMRQLKSFDVSRAIIELA